MVAFTSYHQALPAADAAEINGKLNALSQKSGRLHRMVTSTQSETRVSADNWHAFFAIVLAHAVDELVEAIRNWARKTTLHGPPADNWLPLVRVVSRSGLEASLTAQVTSLGLIVPPDVVISLVDDLIDSARWPIGRRRAKDLGLDIGLYTIWATFDGSGRPYADLPLDVEMVAAELGFDDCAHSFGPYAGDRPLLFLEYTPDKVDPRFPTMIEAWASLPLNYYFSPALAGARWGSTQPWAHCHSSARPRPEVVHSPTPLADILRPVAEVY